MGGASQDNGTRPVFDACKVHFPLRGMRRFIFLPQGMRYVTSSAAALVLRLLNAYTRAIGWGKYMQPTGFQKVAYGVLIALMFGVTTGLIGGL